MIDAEVDRLRRLRVTALRLRALACALGRNKLMRDAPLLNQGRCAAWRVARVVSGRLRAHPYEPYQRDAGLVTLLNNSIATAAVLLTISSRRGALCAFEEQLKAVLRALDDARAFASAADLSDSLGRSQKELRALIAAVHSPAHDRSDSVGVPQAARAAVPVGAWPFLDL